MTVGLVPVHCVLLLQQLVVVCVLLLVVAGLEEGSVALGQWSLQAVFKEFRKIL
jgi:hypothetical protein